MGSPDESYWSIEVQRLKRKNEALKGQMAARIREVWTLRRICLSLLQFVSPIPELEDDILDMPAWARHSPEIEKTVPEKKPRKKSKKKAKGKSIGIRRSTIFLRDRSTCVYCGRNPMEHSVVLQIDHLIPVSAGGTNRADNLVTSCSACNLAKNTKLINIGIVLTQVRLRNAEAGIPDDRDMSAAL
jgi:5-methylcytosine-specific restriction endonuclease McrA